MATNSADVNQGDTATAEQYNDLRADVVNTTSGHNHDNADSRGLSESATLFDADVERDLMFYGPALAGINSSACADKGLAGTFRLQNNDTSGARIYIASLPNIPNGGQITKIYLGATRADADAVIVVSLKKMTLIAGVVSTVDTYTFSDSGGTYTLESKTLAAAETIASVYEAGQIRYVYWLEVSITNNGQATDTDVGLIGVRVKNNKLGICT